MPLDTRVGPRKDTSGLERAHQIAQATRTDQQSTLLVPQASGFPPAGLPLPPG